MELLLIHEEIFQLIPTLLDHHYNFLIFEPEISIVKCNTYSISERNRLKNDVFMLNYMRLTMALSGRNLNKFFKSSNPNLSISQSLIACTIASIGLESIGFVKQQHCMKFLYRLYDRSIMNESHLRFKVFQEYINMQTFFWVQKCYLYKEKEYEVDIRKSLLKMFHGILIFLYQKHARNSRNLSFCFLFSPSFCFL